MTGPTSRARNAAKCARCGHPRAKHATNPADGCTAKVGKAVTGWGGARRFVGANCPCRYFIERQD